MFCFLFGVGVANATIWYDCAYVDGTTKAIFTSLKNNSVWGSGVDQFDITDKESAAQAWEEVGYEYDKVHCLSVTYKDGCSTNSDCPVGYKCGGVEGDDKCSFAAPSCTDNESLLKDFCVIIPANPDKKGACACPHGAPQCMSSPLCSKDLNSLFTGSCKAGYCDEGAKSGDTNVCSDDLWCWQTAIVAKCCESNKCDGPIENCKDDHLPACPPGFTNGGGSFACVYNCPEYGNSCKTDDDCTKGGQNKVCVDLTLNSFSVDKDFALDACKKLGITRRCEFLSTTTPSSTPSSTPVEEYKGIPFTIPDATSLNPITATTPQKLIGTAIKTIMGLIGSIALVMFVYGGVLWMTAMGNSEREKKGREVIVWSGLGVVVILISYIIVDFVFEAFR